MNYANDQTCHLKDHHENSGSVKDSEVYLGLN